MDHKNVEQIRQQTRRVVDAVTQLEADAKGHITTLEQELRKVTARVRELKLLEVLDEDHSDDFKKFSERGEAIRLELIETKAILEPINADEAGEPAYRPITQSHTLQARAGLVYRALETLDRHYETLSQLEQDGADGPEVVEVNQSIDYAWSVVSRRLKGTPLFCPEGLLGVVLGDSELVDL